MSFNYTFLKFITHCLIDYINSKEQLRWSDDATLTSADVIQILEANDTDFK